MLTYIGPAIFGLGAVILILTIVLKKSGAKKNLDDAKTIEEGE